MSSAPSKTWPVLSLTSSNDLHCQLYLCQNENFLMKQANKKLKKRKREIDIHDLFHSGFNNIVCQWPSFSCSCQCQCMQLCTILAWIFCYRRCSVRLYNPSLKMQNCRSKIKSRNRLSETRKWFIVPIKDSGDTASANASVKWPPGAARSDGTRSDAVTFPSRGVLLKETCRNLTVANWLCAIGSVSDDIKNEGSECKRRDDKRCGKKNESGVSLICKIPIDFPSCFQGCTLINSTLHSFYKLPIYVSRVTCIFFSHNV